MVDTIASPTVPCVLFGAFDRHNLGDLLLAWAAERRLAPRRCLFAGLHAADLAVCGAPVQPLAEVIAQWPQRYGTAPLELVHVGGEVLDTDAWEAAVMLLPGDEAAQRVAMLDQQEPARAQWAAAFLGTRRLAPYVVAGGQQHGVCVVCEFRTLGGVGLTRRPAAFQREVAAALRSAAALTVRDRETQAALAALGVAADLAPDPVAQMADGLAGLAATATLPRQSGAYLAVHCAASFGDDATQAALARALDACALPVVLFAAGTAPWHDDFAVYRRLADRLSVAFRIVDTTAVAEVCALIAGARGCVASSLHALLVANALGVPALGIEARAGEAAKLQAYAASWGCFRIATLAAVQPEIDSIFRSQLGL